MNIKPKKILITGGAGYIGSVLASKLIELGHTVSVVDDLSTGKKSNVPSQATLHVLDINSPDFDNVLKADAPEVIVHMAASKSVNESITNPEKFERINIAGSKNVIDLAMKNNIRKLIFTSTAGVYGDVASLKAQKESDTPHPSSPYAVTKLDIEKYILEMNKKGLNGYILRFANVYGPGGDADLKGAINIFIEHVVGGKTIEIHGDGTQTRDFVHIDDLISMCMVLLADMTEAVSTSTPIYNVSTGADISINDLVSLIGELSHMKIHKTYVPNTYIGQKSSLLSTTKSKQELGWYSKIALRDGIQEMLKAYRRTV